MLNRVDVPNHENVVLVVAVNAVFERGLKL